MIIYIENGSNYFSNYYEIYECKDYSVFMFNYERISIK